MLPPSPTINHQPPPPPHAFTLIELLVVMTIIVIMATISIPAIKTLTKGNKLAQSTNLIRSYLSTARSIAISEHRMCGIVFFEETPANIQPSHAGQTAMQLIVEDRNQSQYASTKGNTIFVYYTKNRQYFPSGVQIATINDDPTRMILIGDNPSATIGNSRVIVFDATGQMVIRGGIARRNLTAPPAFPPDGQYPQAYKDWKFTTVSGTPSIGVSSPGVIIFDLKDYQSYIELSAPTELQKMQWVESHADVVMINAYTGGVIR